MAPTVRGSASRDLDFQRNAGNTQNRLLESKMNTGEPIEMIEAIQQRLTSVPRAVNSPPPPGRLDGLPSSSALNILEDWINGQTLPIDFFDMDLELDSFP